MSVTGQQQHDPSMRSDGSSPRRVRFRGLLTLLGILLTPVFLFITVVLAGGGHGTYYAAKTFFPWSMMSTAVTRSITQPLVVLAFAQYPIYFIMLDVARAKGGFRPAALALLAVHFMAIMLAFAISNRSFTP
jgi:hypothetical protein